MVPSFPSMQLLLLSHTESCTLSDIPTTLKWANEHFPPNLSPYFLSITLQLTATILHQSAKLQRLWAITLRILLSTFKRAGYFLLILTGRCTTSKFPAIFSSHPVYFVANQARTTFRGVCDLVL